jgi:hypothetical protein
LRCFLCVLKRGTPGVGGHRLSTNSEGVYYESVYYMVRCPQPPVVKERGGEWEGKGRE